MSAPVIAAVITGTIAAISIGTSAWLAGYSLRRQRDLAHDQRLWERECAVYEEILAYVHHSVEERTNAMERSRGDAVDSDWQDWPGQYEAPNRYLFEARRHAYASKAVRTAFRQWLEKETALELKWQAQMLGVTRETPHDATDAHGAKDPQNDLGAVAAQATRAADVLWDAVRAEIHRDRER
ncbi:hypothetical protein [Yinghuangia seranimata]|uniref:hypothetical protein n=1 Tax=Yinghuangia seranimata TaxID=408067 RepID=UPI00248BDA62|nr:hypothetical protein [Yinghuangia seranimata]MDI2125521.1 hypothetical protein [Yinghuangia seranimata]